MNFEHLDPEMSILYNKAREKFRKCIYDEENKFLCHEINISLEDILIVEKSIKIIFSNRNSQNYLIETNLLLFDKSNEIGIYFYVQNEKGEEMDDSLVFY